MRVTGCIWRTPGDKKYEGLKYSGDFADAAYLAQLLRLGLLPEGYICPREERAARDLAQSPATGALPHRAGPVDRERIIGRVEKDPAYRAGIEASHTPPEARTHDAICYALRRVAGLLVPAATITYTSSRITT